MGRSEIVKKDNRSLDPNPRYKNKVGSYKNHKDPNFGNSPTDIYYKIERKIPGSNVSIPTYDAVVEAKKWVDDINRK
ncbi:MAG: DUF3787 domain-containing protein [Tissierellia bacterium]|nr:DUF3787 domain-containing protein [Tissierellia bacterium]